VYAEEEVVSCDGESGTAFPLEYNINVCSMIDSAINTPRKSPEFIEGSSTNRTPAA
jgi:hypothetical protein